MAQRQASEQDHRRWPPEAKHTAAVGGRPVAVLRDGHGPWQSFVGDRWRQMLVLSPFLHTEQLRFGRVQVTLL